MADALLIGARIRRQRLDQGLKQTALAEACGISPSYLNLIEHDRRRIGGKLLADLASALGTAPESLSAGVEAGEVARLRAAAGGLRSTIEAEVARADEFALRFPGWAGVVVALAQKADDLERRLGVMAERTRQDPVLAASLHNILSVVTAIRSTSGILAGDDPVEPAWQARFHRNLYEESQRLAEATETLVEDLERGEADDAGGDPVVAAEEWLGNWAVLSGLEPGGEGRVALLAAAKAELGEGEAFSIISGLIHETMIDEAALPLADLREALKGRLADPFELADLFDVRLARVMRRLAALPELGAGFIRTDAEGEVVLRRQTSGLTIPRFGASRMLWPLYAALENPGRVEVHLIGKEDRKWERFNTLSISENSPEGLRGTMLIQPVLVSS